MSFLEKFIGVIAPHTCLGCGTEENRLLCEGCACGLPLAPSRCYKCKAVTDDYEVCRSCRATTPLRRVVVYTYHQGLAKELVHRMKYERARQGIHEVADLLASQLVMFPPSVVLTHVPTATTRVRIRGYDHALVLSRVLSRGYVPVRTLLARVGQAHQVGARRTERLRQLEHALRAVHSDQISGQHIVLVDDVLTTGATLETAARVLKRAGAKRVDAIVFAQA